MSASAKKKLRKEQNAAQLTEKQLKEQKEVIELELQHSSIMLNSSDGISVKIPPDFSN